MLKILLMNDSSHWGLKGRLVAFKQYMTAKSLSAALPLRLCQVTSGWGWWSTKAAGESEGGRGGQLWPTPLVTPGAHRMLSPGQRGGGTSEKLLLLGLPFPQPSDRWDD